MAIGSRRMWAAMLTAVVGLTSSAFAQEFRTYSGNLCNPQTSADSDRIQLTQWGVQNNDTGSAAFIECGGTVPVTNGGVSGISFGGYDRSSSDDVCCTFFVQHVSGTVLASADRCTFGNAAAFQVSPGLTFSPSVSGAFVNVQCRIPAKTGSGLSHITSYTISVN